MAYLEPEIEETLSKKDYLEQKSFPLYPGLTEQGLKEYEESIKKAIASIRKKIDEEIGQVLEDMTEGFVEYAETNSWNTMRQRFMYGMTNYKAGKKQSPHSFKEIRKQMLKEDREEIINDLNQDLIEKVAELEKRNKDLLDQIHRSY